MADMDITPFPYDKEYTDTGAVYFFNGKYPMPSRMYVSEAFETYHGLTYDSRFGASIAMTTDVNIDGNIDVLIGAPNFNAYRGGAFILAPLLDWDGDGIKDWNEFNLYYTSPILSDSDGDLLSDLEEVNGWEIVGEGIIHYHSYSNPNSQYTDSDTLSDYEEIKTYNEDPLLDPHNIYLTDPDNSDTDSDGLDDDDEINGYLISIIEDLTGNPDQYTAYPSPIDANSDRLFPNGEDDLDDSEEINIRGTDPTKDDTDSDGLSDYDEIFTHSTEPRDVDSDNDDLNDNLEIIGWDVLVDGASPVHVAPDPNDDNSDDDLLTDKDEYDYGTNPWAADTDLDGLNDDVEITGWDIIVNSETITVYSSPTDQNSDSDSLTDLEEKNLGNVDPMNPDTDGDGTGDGDETLGWTVYVDLNNDGTYDALDGEIYDVFPDPSSSDGDGDGLLDGAEQTAGTDPTSPDTDKDGLDDNFELNTGWTVIVVGETPYTVYSDPLDPNSDADNLDDEEEKTRGTDPDTEYTDPDSLTDSEEVNTYILNPLEDDEDADTDGDLLTNVDEVDVYGTLPDDKDTDNDGMRDGYEVEGGSAPDLPNWDEDRDDDGLLNWQELPSYDVTILGQGVELTELGDQWNGEYIYFTNLDDPDTDNDGLDDGSEAVYWDDVESSDDSSDQDDEEWEDWMANNAYPTPYDPAWFVNYDGDENTVDEVSTIYVEYDEDKYKINNLYDADSDNDGLTDGEEDMIKKDGDYQDLDKTWLQGYERAFFGFGLEPKPWDYDSDDDSVKDGEEQLWHKDSDLDGDINSLDTDSDDDNYNDYSDYEPTFDLHISVKIKEIEAIDPVEIAGEADFYVYAWIAGSKKQKPNELPGEGWGDDHVYPNWVLTKNVDDDVRYVDIKIALYDDDVVWDEMCDIDEEDDSGNDDDGKPIKVQYDVATESWENIYGDTGTLGYVYGGNDGSGGGEGPIHEDDCKLYYDIYNEDATSKYALLAAADCAPAYLAFKNDIKLAEDYLMDLDSGWAQSRIWKLTWGSGSTIDDEATTQNILDALEDIELRSITGSTVFIMISDHGYSTDEQLGDSWFNTKDGSISDDTFATYVNDIDYLNMVILMDLCFSGGFLDELSVDENSNPATNRFVGLSSSKDEYSWGGANTYGYYAEYFFDKLKTNGGDVKDAHLHADDELEGRQFDGQYYQNPVYYDSFDPDFILS